MSGMGWIGGVINLLTSIGGAYESHKMKKSADAVFDREKAVATPAAQRMTDWGVEDLGRFNDRFEPFMRAYADRVNRAPEHALAEQKAMAPITQMVAKGQAALAGSTPVQNGQFRVGLQNAAGAGVRAGSPSRSGARATEDQNNWLNRARYVMQQRALTSDAAKVSSVAQDSRMRGLKQAMGVRDSYGAAAEDAYGELGKSIGGFNYKGLMKKQENTDGMFGPSNAGESGEYFDMQGGYADGGLVTGPGTGRSDSIPAEIDGQAPARVSNGEYIIPAAAANAIGHERLQQLIDAVRARRGGP